MVSSKTNRNTSEFLFGRVPHPMNAISIQKLTKTYANGTRALRGVDLEVETGDFCALLGANGAGKTTIIGILTGLVNKTAGKAGIFGHDIDTHHMRAKRITGHTLRVLLR